VPSSDAQKVDLEHEGRVRRNHAASAARAIAEVGGDGQHARAADLHALHPFVPATDDLAFTETEGEGLATVLAGIELLAAREAKIREWFSTNLVTDETLGALFAEDLRVLRNEIYARHGRVFKDAKLQKYFDAQSWYKANPDFKDYQLNEIEVQNLAKIKEAEETATSKFAEAEG